MYWTPPQRPAPARASLADPVPCEIVHYAHGLADLQRRLVGEFRTGDEAEIELGAGRIRNGRTGQVFETRPLGAVEPVVRAGGIFGYARATGDVGVALVTSGPGATNAVTGLTDALMDSIPIICLTGQVPTHLIGNDAFQEADIVGITRPVTKHNYLVLDRKELGRIIKEAFLGGSIYTCPECQRV